MGELSKANKVLHNLAYTAVKSSPLEIVTEGIEEAINGIAQSEGTSYAKRMLYGKDTMNPPSRFIDEIKSDYIERIKEYADKLLEVSNGIIVHDLISAEGLKITECEYEKE